MKIMPMYSFEKTSCRFCFKNITDKGFQGIDSVTRDILDGLLLKFKFHGDSQDICNSCRRKLKAALEFKSTCLSTNNMIIHHVDCNKMLQVDLREVYIKENGSRHVRSISYDDKICRLCMKLIKGEIRCIGEEELEAIQKFIPEMNMMVIKDPVLCTPCFNSLGTHNAFLNDCLKVEQNITCSLETSAAEIKTDTSSFNSFVKNEEAGIESKINDEEANIKTECIDIKSEEIEESDIPSWKFKDEPVEFTSECQPEYIETINDSMFMNEEIQHGIKNENCELKYRETFDEQTYKHDSCDYETDKHQRSHEDIPKEHKCNFCDYKSIYKANVNKHQLRHKDIPQDRMYKCESCDYKTIYKHCLIQHKLKHTDNPEKQLYKCDSCDYRTNYKQRLAQHQLVKHKDVLEEQMFKCDSCDYKTICKTNLNKHQLRHKDIPEDQMYKCDLCDFKTTYNRSLIRHNLRHKDIPEDQMYKCDICDYKTIYKSSLKKHQLRHKNIPEEQMFKCDMCDYKTIYKSNLNKHQLKHKVEKQM